MRSRVTNLAQTHILPAWSPPDDRSFILVILGTTVARLGASDPTKGDTVKGRRVGLAAVIRLASLDKPSPETVIELFI